MSCFLSDISLSIEGCITHFTFIVLFPLIEQTKAAYLLFYQRKKSQHFDINSLIQGMQDMGTDLQKNLNNPPQNTETGPFARKAFTELSVQDNEDVSSSVGISVSSVQGQTDSLYETFEMDTFSNAEEDLTAPAPPSPALLSSTEIAMNERKTEEFLDMFSAVNQEES